MGAFELLSPILRSAVGGRFRSETGVQKKAIPEVLGGQRINRNGFLWPYSKYICTKDAEVYLTDGTFFGGLGRLSGEL
ncbi:MAG: hypothetical protein ABH829_03730 [archaeon]